MYMIGMGPDLVTRDLARSDVLREIQLVSRERDDNLAKHFAVYIRAAPLIVKKILLLILFY